MKTLGNVPSLGWVNVSGMPEKSQKAAPKRIDSDSGLSLLHLGIEMVFNSGIEL